MSNGSHHPSPPDDQRHKMTLLWTQAHSTVRGYVAMVIRDRHAVEDVVQDVATAIAQDFEQYDPSKPFKSWALGIARHRVLQYLDRSKRDRHLFNDEILQQLAEQTQAYAARQLEYEDALEDCLSALPAKTREIVVLKYLRDMPAREIANLHNQTLGSVTGVLRRARAALAQCIKTRLDGVGVAG